MRNAWLITVTRVFIALLAGAIIGLVYGSIMSGMLLAALAALGWHLYQLYRLHHWLRTNDFEDFPMGRGIWSEVFAGVSFYRLRARRRGKRLRSVLAELRQSASVFPDAGIILNANNEAIYFNKAARRLLGLKKSTDLGQRIENLVRAPQFVNYLNTGDFEEELEFALPPTNKVWVLCRIVGYGPDQRLLIIQDVSRKKKLETIRRDFLANASHELRTPLTVITGYIDVLENEPDLGPGVKGPLQEMRRQSGRMRALLDDLLRLSELESADLSSRQEAVSVADLMSFSRQAKSPLTTQAHNIEIDAASDKKILGVMSELQSVISNLVINAATYSPQSSSITLRWSTDETGGYLSVNDTGIGIAAKDIPRITERFYRADAGRSSDTGGTGLGLAIVKHVLKRHEAELHIESELGKGSTFTCFFPTSRLLG